MPGRTSTPSSLSFPSSALSLSRMDRSYPRAKQQAQLIEYASYASRANRQNRIAGLGLAHDVLHSALHGAGENHVGMPRLRDGLGQQFAGNALDRLFARRINLRQDQ